MAFGALEPCTECGGQFTFRFNIIVILSLVAPVGLVV